MRRFRIAFVLDQVAGHVTNAQNLRRVLEDDDEIDPVWGEINYVKEGGRIERAHDHLRWLPSHPFGVARGVVEQRRVLTQRPVDAIMTNTSIAHYQVGPLRRTPTLFDFDSTPVQLDRMGGYADPDSGATAWAKLRLMRRLFHSVDINHAWSHWAQQSVIDDYGVDPNTVVVNPPGVDLARWTTHGRSPSTPGEPSRVLFVGGDFERKGGHDLLAWHASLAPGTVDLDIVTREDVSAQPGVKVHHGLQPNSAELMELYRRADVFVLPSHGECFGIATVEAMACGIPVVVSDVGGTADIVDPGENGYIVPAHDAPALGRAIEQILADPAMAAHMGRHGRSIAEERFDVSRNAKRTLELLKQLADRSRSASASAPA